MCMYAYAGVRALVAGEEKHKYRIPGLNAGNRVESLRCGRPV